jgi:hypothetical protein
MKPGAPMWSVVMKKCPRQPADSSIGAVWWAAPTPPSSKVKIVARASRAASSASTDRASGGRGRRDGRQVLGERVPPELVDVGVGAGEATDRVRLVVGHDVVVEQRDDPHARSSTGRMMSGVSDRHGVGARRARACDFQRT